MVTGTWTVVPASTASFAPEPFTAMALVALTLRPWKVSVPPVTVVAPL